jgi:predicted nucleotidyltransferase
MESMDPITPINGNRYPMGRDKLSSSSAEESSAPCSDAKGIDIRDTISPLAKAVDMGVGLFNKGLSVLSLAHLEISPRASGQVRIQKGYSPEVEEVSVDAPHSIDNLGKYLEPRLPSRIAEEIKNDDLVAELHKCTDLEALKSLHERGFTRTHLVDIEEISGAPAGGHLLFRTRNPATGEVRYALTNIVGNDMELHNQLQLKFAGVESKKVLVFDHGSDGGLLIDKALKKVGAMPEKVIIGYRGLLKAELTRRALFAHKLSELQSRLGGSPWRGLLRELDGALQKSSNHRKRTELLAVIQAVRKNADGEKVLSLPPTEVFRKGDNALKMEETETFLKDLSERHPNLKVLSDLFEDGALKINGKSSKGLWAGETIDDFFFPMQVFTFERENGTKERILDTRFLYGDLCGKAAEKMADCGAKEIIHLGNAGGLLGCEGIGEIHFPSQIYDGRGRQANRGLENCILKYLKSTGEGPRDATIHLSTRQAKAASPLLETRELIHKLKRRGMDAIDVEAAEIARAVGEANAAGKDVKLSTALLISDLPSRGGGKTLEAMKENEQSVEQYRKSITFLIDTIIEYWRIKDVEISGEANFRPRDEASMDARVPSTPMPGKLQILKDMKSLLSRKYVIRRKKSTPEGDLACKIAERILEEKNINDPSHGLLRGNIASYLVNGATAGTLEEIWKSDNFDAEKVSSHMEPSRWKEKISRDLKDPYTDDQIISHIKDLDKELKEKMRAIISGSKRFPSKLYILGSFAKGRLGANSDLDILVEVEDEASRKSLGSDYALKLRRGEDDKVLMVPIAPQNRFLRAFNDRMLGKKLDLEDGRQILEEPDFLLKRYAEIMEKKGYRLGEAGQGAPAIQSKREVRSLFLDNLIEKLVQKKHSSFEKNGAESSHRITVREILGTVAGAMLLFPGFGAILDKMAEEIIPSK